VVVEVYERGFGHGGSGCGHGTHCSSKAGE
jgi:hypothetical protein